MNIWMNKQMRVPLSVDKKRGAEAPLECLEYVEMVEEGIYYHDEVKDRGDGDQG